MKKLIWGFTVTLVFTGLTEAAIVWNTNGDCGMQFNNTVDENKISLDLYSINDNNNVTFDSMEIYAQNIFDTLYLKTQQFSTFSGTKDEFIASLSVGINGTESEILSGWNTSIRADGTVDWSHAEGGLPGIDYVEFLSTNVDPSQDMGVTTFGIAWQYADWNKDGVFNAADGDGIVISSTDSYDAFKGVVDIDNQYGVQANFAPTAAVPEPATMTMLGLAGLLIAAKRRFFG